MFNRYKALSNNKSHAGKSGIFNADFLPWWGKEEGQVHEHSWYVASVLDNRQHCGSRPCEVDNREDALTCSKPSVSLSILNLVLSVYTSKAHDLFLMLFLILNMETDTELTWK